MESTNPRCTNCDHYKDEHEDGFGGCCVVYDDPDGPVVYCPCAEFLVEDSPARGTTFTPKEVDILKSLLKGYVVGPGARKVIEKLNSGGKQG